VSTATPAFSDSVPKGHVVTTDPSPGARVLDHGTVTITLSRGKELYAVPKTRNLTEDQAQDALLKAHLTFGRAIRKYNETVPRGTVLGSNPAAGKREGPQTVVDLILSRGKRPVHIRDWQGLSAARAKRVLTAQHLQVDTSDQEYSDSVAKGLVISQSPPTGILHRGDTVSLKVSRGPELVQIPGDLQAMGVEDATTLLQSLGFRVHVVNSPYYIGLGYVYSSNPDPGEMAPKGSLVTIEIV
jgi:serine/threonine-protein kinase